LTGRQSQCDFDSDFDFDYESDEGDDQCIQWKTSLRGPKSVRKVDGLSFSFIDFYVPALTSRLNSTEASL
jgi:hypothetical protein